MNLVVLDDDINKSKTKTGKRKGKDDVLVTLDPDNENAEKTMTTTRRGETRQ